MSNGQASVPAVPVVMVPAQAPRGTDASVAGSLGLALAITAAALAFFGMGFWLWRPVVAVVPILIGVAGVGVGALALGNERGRGQAVGSIITGGVTVVFVGGALAMRMLA